MTVQKYVNFNAATLETKPGDGRFWGFDASVFQVRGPACPRCADEIDFSYEENDQDATADAITWFCRKNCGFIKRIEIL